MFWRKISKSVQIKRAQPVMVKSKKLSSVLKAEQITQQVLPCARIYLE